MLESRTCFRFCCLNGFSKEEIVIAALFSCILLDGLRYDEMEFDEDSEPEIPVYNRAELIERYQVFSNEF